MVWQSYWVQSPHYGSKGNSHVEIEPIYCRKLEEDNEVARHGNYVYAKSQIEGIYAPKQSVTF
jgi:hypothetical protein